jgi:hypothetical protein
MGSKRATCALVLPRARAESHHRPGHDFAAYLLMPRGRTTEHLSDPQPRHVPSWGARQGSRPAWPSKKLSFSPCPACNERAYGPDVFSNGPWLATRLLFARLEHPQKSLQCGRSVGC